MTTLEAHRPLFIVGAPRSGTTLLQTLVDGYSPIAIPPESHVFPRFYPFLDGYGDLRQPLHLRALVRDLLTDEKIVAWDLQTSVEEFCRELPTDSTARDVIGRLYRLYARKEGKSCWGDKTTVHVLYMREIRSLFPEAQFVHILRDGRDVAESLARIAIGKKSAWANAHRWVQYVQAAEAFQRQAPPGTYLEVRYENLVRQPDEEMRRLFAFLGLGSVSVGRAVPETGLKQHYLQRAPHHGLLDAPISDQKIGAFKTGLRPRDIEVFEMVAGETLRRYGYELVTNGAARLTWRDRLRFFFQDTFLRSQRKVGSLALFQQLQRELKESLQLRLRKHLRSRRRPRTSVSERSQR